MTKVENYFRFEEEDTITLVGISSYFYNSQDLLSSISGRRLDSERELVNYDRTAFTYYDNGLLKDEKEYYWLNNRYMPAGGKSYYYNSDSTLDLVFPYRINENNEFEETKAPDKYTYDQHGNLLRIVEWYYDSNILIDPMYEELVAYNSQVNSENVLMPRTYEMPLSRWSPRKNMLLSIRENEIDAFEERTQTSLEEYFYTEIETSSTVSTDYESTNFVIYPNPSAQSITLSNSDLSNKKADLNVYNSRGELHRSQEITIGSEIDISLLESGLYYIKVQSSETQFFGKVVKI